MVSAKQYATSLAKQAKQASSTIAILSTEVKNQILNDMADAILKNKAKLVQENKKDLLNAKKNKITKAMLKRLTLSNSVIESMAKGLNEIALFEDPVGQIETSWNRPNGLKLSKVKVPLGVVLIIYESRPNVTVDCIGLCIKSGNVPLLRGGKEAFYSNKTIFTILDKVIQKYDLPKGSINFIDRTDYEVVNEILVLSDYIDLVIPRGGERLIHLVTELSHIPVIKHYKGICHVYIDKEYDDTIAEKIAINSKVQKPSVCNAMETLLVHKLCAKKVLPGLVKKYQNAGVEVRGCEKTCAIVKGVKKANQEDWSTEYLDYVLSIKIVNTLEEAISHIEKYGSHHTDAIISTDINAIDAFVKKVDSACVFVNVSTRFSDGSEFGFGAEIGISTDKFHARGPMGVADLTTYKYVVVGQGQIRK